MYLMYGFPHCKTVNAVDCDDDEVCQPIHLCERELKLYKERNFSLLKVCGVYSKDSVKK